MQRLFINTTKFKTTSAVLYLFSSLPRTTLSLSQRHWNPFTYNKQTSITPKAANQSMEGHSTSQQHHQYSTTANDVLIVYVTVPSKELGRTIAMSLVSEQLAACTNIIPGLESIYYWDGKVQSDEELLLLIKTRAPLLSQLTRRVRELHSYTECEVVAVPVVGGSASYLEWVLDSTKKV